MSIGRALNCKLRIQQFCNTHHPKRGDGIENDRLKPLHWFLLEKLYETLGAFYEATLCNEGKHNILSGWFFALDYLLESIDESKNEFQVLACENPKSEEYAYLQASAAAAWAKAEEYYSKVDQSAAYYAALVLDPAFKWAWFEGRWLGNKEKKVWLEGNPKSKAAIGAKGMVRALWEEEYKGKYTPDLPPTMHLDENPSTEGEPSQPRDPDDRFGGLHRHKQLGGKWATGKAKASLDHYGTFILTEPEREKINALEFWNARYTSQPDLARFALDMLAIPAMSAECERVFSSAKHLITDARNRLDPGIIEANECLKHWFGLPKEEEGSKKDGPKGKKGSKGEEGPKEGMDPEPEVSEEVEALQIRKAYESDVEDGAIYDVDSDGEIVLTDGVFYDFNSDGEIEWKN